MRASRGEQKASLRGGADRVVLPGYKSWKAPSSIGSSMKLCQGRSVCALMVRQEYRVKEHFRLKQAVLGGVFSAPNLIKLDFFELGTTLGRYAKYPSCRVAPYGSGRARMDTKVPSRTVGSFGAVRDQLVQR